MAAINVETITISISRIQRINEELNPIATQELTSTVESIVQELVGENAIVEVEVNNG